MHGFGNMLKDYLKYYNISQTDFAERLGITQKHMNEILNENTGISNDLILAISLITDIDPKLILLAENKKKIYDYLNERYKTEKEIKAFLDNFYIKEMYKAKWIELKDRNSYVQTALDLLDYLNVKSFDILNTYINKRILFKKKNNSNEMKTYLWIKMCDKIARNQSVTDYDSSKLNTLMLSLEEERNKPFNIDSITQMFNQNGIYLVVMDALSGTKVRGCTMVKDKNPAIYLTKYQKEKASFYYALYHELGHVNSDYNMAKNKTLVEGDCEEKADVFALNCMIKKDIWNKILSNMKDKEEICKDNNIPLCFLYSRLAREGIINYTDVEYIKNREQI